MTDIPEPARSTIIVSTVILFIAWIAVALRFYVRWLTKVGVASDDWWVLMGIVLSASAGSTYLYGVIKDPAHGANMDRDSPTFDYAPRVTFMKVSYSIAMMYFSLISTVKVSILLMYRRIFPVDCFRRKSLILGIIVVLWWLSGTVATAVYCVPLRQYWEGPSVGGYCWNYNIFWMVMGGIEVIIDTAILVLPVRMVWQLQLTLQSKILVICVFLLGGFVVVTGIARTVYGYEPGSTNVDYEHGELWSCIHVGTAIICACLPTLRPLLVIGTGIFSAHRRRRYGSTNRRSNGSSMGRYQQRSRSEMLRVDSRNDFYQTSPKDYGRSQHDYPKTPQPSAEQIHVEERVDVEWSRLARTESNDGINLISLPQVYIGK